MIQEEKKMMEEIKQKAKQKHEIQDSPSIINPKMMKEYEA